MLQMGPREETGRRPVTLGQHGEAYGRMAAVRQVSDLRVLVDGWRRAGERVGVVPTMGALHAGHLALIAAAKADCARVIATLSVNPKDRKRVVLGKSV